MEPIERLFGAAIRRRRQKLGLSQEDFADHAGIHRTYISSIELGKVKISISVAQQLADALKTPLSRIWQEIERSHRGATT
jgi:transcriptional regulator with XRE-family HTH domain